MTENPTVVLVPGYWLGAWAWDAVAQRLRSHGHPVVAVTLHYFAIPDGAIALVIAVDHVLDMGRSATNVAGNSVAAAVVAKWEDRNEPQPDSAAS